MAPSIPVTAVPHAASGWRLTAPESYVLLNGAQASGVEAFKTGVLEIVARGALAIETHTEPGFFDFGTC